MPVFRAHHFESLDGVGVLEGDFFPLVDRCSGELGLVGQDFLPRGPAALDPVAAAGLVLGLGVLGGEFLEEGLVDGGFAFAGEDVGGHEGSGGEVSEEGFGEGFGVRVLRGVVGFWEGFRWEEGKEVVVGLEREHFCVWGSERK